MPSGPVRRPPHELAFAAAIRAARIEAGRTQADVAAAADLPVRTVQRAEQGLRRVTLGDAAAIAQSLGRSLDELVHGRVVDVRAAEDGPTSAC
jgi:transcriptional regulator with XRE-family HTH domain